MAKAAEASAKPPAAAKAAAVVAKVAPGATAVPAAQAPTTAARKVSSSEPTGPVYKSSKANAAMQPALQLAALTQPGSQP